ncbi:MAG: N-acetylmuramoyl-L-alanine amidase [Desulfobacteraceae bacterium]|nr:N-acetylmuramoyl-L-alanine amidase [Desulfobacteraceae bacterium]
MLNVDKEGWVNNVKIVKEHRSSIEHLPLSIINAVVVHRTASVSASSVLNAYKKQKEGTHLLIDENGKVIQTASLKKQCWHVGKLYSRCKALSSCSEEDAEAIEAILHKKNTGWGQKYRLVTRHELKKVYPDRFPHNHDSIGIEIVGMISKSEIYEIPNKLQLKSFFWLLDELISTFSFSLNDIYAHGKIAHKDKKQSEGAAALKAYLISKKGK